MPLAMLRRRREYPTYPDALVLADFLRRFWRHVLRADEAALDGEPFRVSDADDDTGTGNILRCPALGPLRQCVDFVAERLGFRRYGF